MIVPYYRSHNRDFTLLHGDSFELLPQFEFKFDMIFADPPYFLSNDGISSLLSTKNCGRLINKIFKQTRFT